MASGQSDDRLYDLLAGALVVWRLDRAVSLRREDGTRVSIADETGLEITVSALSGSDTDRWRVVVVRSGGETADQHRESVHPGTTGMLRAVRSALDPGTRPARMIVAPPPPPE